VGAELQTVVESDEQVLALRLDRGDRRADDAADLGTWLAGASGADDATDEMWTETRGGSEEGVAFGHELRASARTQCQAAIALPKSCGEQSLPEWGIADALAVDFSDHKLPNPSVVDEATEGTECHLGDFGIVGRWKGLDRRAATFEVDGGDAIDQNDVPAGRTLQGPSIVFAATRPGERRTVRIRGIGRCEQKHLSLLGGAGGLANGP